MQPLPDLLSAIGRFHPLILHFPIGLIAGVAVLELWMAARRDGQLRRAIGVLLTLGSIGAVVAALCGLLLAQSGEYDEGLLFQHRLFGLATAALSVTALVLHRWVRRSRAGYAVGLYRLSLAACVIAIAGAAHYGGIITHGGKTPFSTLATALRGSFAHDDARVAVDGEAMRDEDPFQHSVLQILESRCYECHSEQKQKSGLRLDSRAAALAGGESGQPAIVPGNAMESQMVKAITLPRSNKRSMPPTGKQRLEPREVLLLIDWINHGATWPDTYQQRPDGVAPPSAAAMDELRGRGFHVSQLAVSHPLVRVDRVPQGARLAALAPIAEQIAWLNLDGFELDVGELRVLADMPHLTRLELQRSNVQDADLVHVETATQLALLNLYETQIGDPGLNHLGGLRSLQRLYVWQTQVTSSGLQRLRERLPTAVIERGGEDVQSPETSTAARPSA